MNLSNFTQRISNTKTTLQEKIQSNKTAKAMVLMLFFTVLLFGAIFAYKFAKILLMSHPAMPPVSVSAMPATYQEWQPKLRALGTLRAIQGVDITTELPGMIKKIHLTPGSSAKAGDMLVELNADSEIAQRDALQATVELAEITYKRDKSQFAVHAISQATLDFDKADLNSKKAQLAQAEAIVAKKIIRAPFAGTLGISAINLGQYLNTGDKVITLQSLDPIYVDFSLPQQALASLKVGQKITLKIDTYKEAFVGQVTSMDPKIDASTRNIQIEATIANSNLKLYPGMFGEVDIYTGAPQRHLTLPKTAISFNPFGEIVYIITETGKDKAGKPILSVQQKFVSVGESRGDQTTITKGLKERDQVVLAGQQKLKNGTVVTIHNEVLPDTDPAPDLIDE
ncbi:MAG: efflux RND transporter periplasmic adaptor subunit [Candidatus Paracaedibacter sp.]